IVADSRRADPYYSYLIITSVKLYKFHETTSNHDSIDLTHMDTAVDANYAKGFELSDSIRTVSGYRNKDDYATFTELWTNFFDPNAKYDILYPPTGVAQYFVQYFAFDKKGNQHYVQVLGDNVQASLRF